MIFVDNKNSLKTHVTFNTSDSIKGSIYHFDQTKLSLDNSVPLEKVKDISYEIGSIRGNWQSEIFIDDEMVSYTQGKCLPLPNPLFSDGRYREDLIWLKKKDIHNAEQWKNWIELMQRHEDKLRK